MSLWSYCVADARDGVRVDGMLIEPESRTRFSMPISDCQSQMLRVSIRYGVGVRTEQTILVKKLDEDFFQDE